MCNGINYIYEEDICLYFSKNCVLKRKIEFYFILHSTEWKNIILASRCIPHIAVGTWELVL